MSRTTCITGVYIFSLLPSLASACSFKTEILNSPYNNITILWLVPGADPSLETVYNTMRPAMEREDWHIHDPSRIMISDGMLMIGVTGKAQEDGYK